VVPPAWAELWRTADAPAVVKLAQVERRLESAMPAVGKLARVDNRPEPAALAGASQPCVLPPPTVPMGTKSRLPCAAVWNVLRHPMEATTLADWAASWAWGEPCLLGVLWDSGVLSVLVEPVLVERAEWVRVPQ